MLNKRIRRVESLLAIGVAAILVYSSVIHLANPFIFLNSVAEYHLLPSWGNVVVAAFLPMLQLTISLSLFLNRFRFGSAVCTALLFAIFLVAQILAYFSGAETDCGCFGIGESEIGLQSISFVLFLFSVSLVITVVRTSEPGIERAENTQLNRNVDGSQLQC